ncbi:MAG: LysM peptidoglycan-binding domain-containing protein [Bacteroidia bacterium]|nr:LysM peptidoglycan-binding domain-containing protein [Bacteroidia bacterium]
MKSSVILFALVTLTFPLFSQVSPKLLTDENEPEVKPTVSTDSLEMDSPTKGSSFLELTSDDPVSSHIEGLQRDYSYAKPTTSLYDTLLLNTQGFRSAEVPTYAASTIRSRMYELPTIIPLDYNSFVQRYIDVYTIRKRDQTARMMGLSKIYFPLFEEHFDRAGLPLELKYLSVVESALNPHARSRVGATGLWQFMLGTAKMYDLEVNSYVDERCDPVKSTEAATRYLKNAYAEFGDWLLAIASYNCGSGNVRKAIARSGGKRNFWEIMEFLPRETRGYVPAFVAATYSFEYASEHNIYPIYVDFEREQDTLHISRLDITLQEIAEITRTDYELLKNLNPELKIDRIPYSTEPYVLNVPTQTAVYFAANSRQISSQYGKRRENFAPVNMTFASSTSAPSSRSSETYTPKGSSLVYYTVRSGDVVGAIAEKYNVTPAQIANWNDLRRYRIKAGQKLKIYTSKSVAQQAGARPVSGSVAAPIAAPKSAGNITTHTVRAGETLWGIANQYDGVNVETILALNHGVNAKNLKVGQKIRVR